MKVSFEGVGEKVVTFYNDGDTPAVAGDPVTLSGNGQVKKADSGQRFFGVAIAAGEDFAAVQTGGYMQIPYTGVAPTLGYVNLTADGFAGVKTSCEGDSFGEFLVVDVDTDGKIVGLII